MDKTTTLVTGATGFIGRWLVLELIASGHTVTALMRNPESQLPQLRKWIKARGGQDHKLLAVQGDLSQENIGLSEKDLGWMGELRHIFHLGAAMQWNLDLATAREINVRPIRFLARLAEQSAHFERFVQMSGFMIANPRRLAELGLDQAENVSEKHWLSLYRKLGSYEASKYESHFQLLRQLQAASIPYTVINPGVVIGHSVTGEISQYDSIVAMIHALYKGKLPAIPGNRKDWLPVIPVDFVAKFTARIIGQVESQNQQYTLIDKRTPDLASLLARLSGHFQVPVVKRRVPIGLLKTVANLGFERFLPLPSEPLSFISSEQFDIGNTEAMSAQIGLSLPDFDVYLRRFSDYLLLTGFLQKDAPSGVTPAEPEKREEPVCSE